MLVAAAGASVAAAVLMVMIVRAREGMVTEEMLMVTAEVMAPWFCGG